MRCSQILALTSDFPPRPRPYIVQTAESDTVYVVNFLPNAVLTEETELLSFLPLFPYFRLEGIVPLTNGGRRTLPRFAK